jgi:subfamily B ATP-binding cassette protein MsbA
MLSGLLLIIINRISSLILPASTKYLIDGVILQRRLTLLYPLVGIVLLATCIQGLTSLGLTQTLSKGAETLISELRRRVQEHVGRLPVSYYDANKSGVLVSRIMNDVEGVRNLIGVGLVDLVGGMLTVLLAFAVLFWINPVMTGMAVASLGIFGLALHNVFGAVRPILRESVRISSDVKGRLTESLGGIRVVKAYHAEALEHRTFSLGIERLLQNAFRLLKITSIVGLSSSTFFGCVAAIAILVGTRQILSGELTLGGLLTYTIFLGYMATLLMQAVAVGTLLTESIAGLEHTRDLLNEAPEDAATHHTVVIGDIRGDVIFDHVQFAYEHRNTVLHDISFRAASRSVTALVGSSGAGKSTIIELIAAFHKPNKGMIFVDGIDLSQVSLESYRSQLGMVLQDSFLFDGTIRENVAFSKPGATTAEILRACAIARVDEFAKAYPAKYDTVVGERGVKLSGGQRQRVSIARAILANPRILILDEATSSLDSESEAMIQEGLFYLMRNRTTFVIAHRLSTIRSADQILVVEAGRIVERGTHNSLLDSAGRYCDLYTRQYGSKENSTLASRGLRGEYHGTRVAKT